MSQDRRILRHRAALPRGTKPTRRPFVHPDDGYRLEGRGPEDSVTAGSVFVWDDMLRELAFAADHAADHTQTALLIGPIVENSVGLGIEVRGYVGLERYADLDEFREDTIQHWSMLQNRIARIGDGFAGLGWVHLRGDGEHGLSEAERLVHRTFFNLPYQITMTLEGSDERVSIFGFDESGWLRQTRFHVVQPLDGDG